LKTSNCYGNLDSSIPNIRTQDTDFQNHLPSQAFQDNQSTLAEWQILYQTKELLEIGVHQHPSFPIENHRDNERFCHNYLPT
jgi:hypothetical protein